MDSLISRYRNLTVLLLVIFAQLLLVAYQVKSSQEVRLIRVWTVTAVTPLARFLEGARSGTVNLLERYVLLQSQGEENQRLRAELGRLKMENQQLRSELETADRVRALAAFQTASPSKTVAARVIGTGTGASSKVVFVDRGSAVGVKRGMAVVTPDGIVGKVVAAYPIASQVLLITDPTFAAGVISQKHRVHGTLKGRGHGLCLVDYVQNEQRVERGEWFYTSGDDGVFPKGFPAGPVATTQPGDSFQQISVTPSGLQRGIEEVLIILEGVHQAVPEGQAASAEIHVLPRPAPDPALGPPAVVEGQPKVTGTEADRLKEQYRALGAAQGHAFGAGAPGSRPPDFTRPPQPTQPPSPPPGQDPAASPPPRPAP
ncbi:MAG: rod shape-determining protein MreC [Acidobacteria bacterium]|nr:rod shape-determining protein MreC [Acidobacteriota bacterium]